MARLARLAAAALLLVAGCAVPRTSPSAEATASPSVTPGPAFSIGSVPPASALPSDLFPCSLTSDTLVVSLHAPHGIVEARLPLEELGGPSGAPGSSAAASPAPAGANPSSSAPGDADAGELVGGATYTMDLSLDLSDHQQPIAPDVAEGSVSIEGAVAPLHLTIAGPSLAVTLPDGHGASTLAVGLTFHNAPCTDLVSNAIVRFRMIPAATAAACPTGQPGYVALLEALKPALTIADVTRAMAVQAFQARYVNVSGLDAVPLFAGYNPTAPAATASSGQPVKVASAVKGITLAGAHVQVWRREDVVGADGTLLATPGNPIASEDPPASKGTVAWSAPTVAGEYIVGIQPAWSQACMTGTGYVYMDLSVR